MPLPNQTTLLNRQICQSLPEHMRVMMHFISAISWHILLLNLEKWTQRI
jgi:hypothetical protein